jgi:tripartite-type tricarboxylate transporter receptor subunit TctC
MSRSMYRLAVAVAAISSVAWNSVPVSAADAYPSRVIKWIVGFPPGGTTDIIARLMAQRLAESLGQQIIVENRAGAGGNIGTQAVVSAPPDGYTCFLPQLRKRSV